LNEARLKWFKKTVQTVSYMPRFISTVVVIAMLGELLSPSSGLLNRFLVSTFGIEPIYFVNLPQWFRPIYVFTDAWQYTGWTAIIYLAAISNINADLYEAAEIDGASRLQKILHVTIPSIMPTIMVMLILNVGRMLSLGFEKVLLLYTPNNSRVSDILDTLVYRTGIAGGVPNYSYATAIGLFSGVIGLILVSSANFVSRKTTGESIY
jgi:putative aldouronate transport system permease protein